MPVGWAEVPIGEICDLKNGRAFKPAEWQGDGLPIVRIQNLNKRDAPYNYFAGEVGERNRLRGGELLFAWSGTPGTSFGAHIWAGGDAVLNQHIFRVDFNDALFDKRFLKHAINQTVNDLIDIAHGGVGLRHVTKGKFEATKIAVAPLAEQQRIADKLDAILARVDACRDRLDRVAPMLQRFRQSVVNVACGGALGLDRQNSSESEWDAAILGDLLEGKPRNGYSPKSVDYVTGTRTLTLSATTSGRFKPEHFKYIDEVIPPDSHLWLSPGNILIQRANTLEYVGTSAIYDRAPASFIYPDLMMKCRANARVLPEFLLLLLKSDPVRQWFRSRATGTAGNMPKINQQTVMYAPVRVPPLKVQREITDQVRRLMTLADELERRTTLAATSVGNLVPSALAKAFRGELVPHDADDESAAVMVARLAVQGSPQRASKRGRRTA
ncbi:restriction endonuclease subunit S [Pseudaquabacterium pictum]|uniref:Type I restriction enzyme EcoEI specificity protein n=1 Tax=Pseudaquabacterium pictum TaxID=2315236 RepID=A0A480AY31_9BURK|nr:restriction endonuclease subunit S [Rubrivivax pictus]GCL65152.1 type I restriction enzyme EcoEI specificity protein [Rubrivivax pictus]